MQQLIEWHYLGSGSSSSVYVNEDKTLVLKFLMISESQGRYPFENIERSVRIWNEINSHITPRAIATEGQLLPDRETDPVDGIIVPYIDGRQATDKEIQALVLDIYNRTGRILIDAATSGNCLTRYADNCCVCVDIDLALTLDQQDTAIVSTPAHRASFASFQSWNSLQQQFRQGNLELKKDEFPLTVDTIKALIFLKSVRPDISNASFLSGSTERHLLASAYEENQTNSNTQHTRSMTNLAQDLLEQERPAHLSNLKSTCVDLLTRYLSFEEAFGAKASHIEEIKKYIQDIHDTTTSEEMIRYIEALHIKQQDPSRLRTILGKCLLASDALYHSNNRKSLIHTVFFFSKYIYNSSNLLSILSVHTLDLINICSKILLPIFFLEIFDQNISHAQVFIPLMIIVSLPVLTEFKNKLLVDISLDVVERFTRDFSEVAFNTHLNNAERFRESFSPGYVEDISLFIRKTYGKLLPSYAAALGFVMAIAFKDKLVGGFAASALFLYFGYTYYFLNPQYSHSFKANLAENKTLYEQLHRAIRQQDLIKHYDKVDDEKNTISRVLTKVIPTTKKKNYYDSQTKIVGMLTGNVTFFIGATYWVSTYQHSSESITDYILLYYYLYMFSMIINQLSPLISQLLSSAEYSKRLIQYSMWSAGNVQDTYKKQLNQRNATPQDSQTSVGWQLDCVSFSNVWYKNHSSKQILKNISFSIKKNDFFAFVGKTMDDTSAIIRLLRRETIPLSGEIMFHPSSIDALEEHALHQLLAIIDSKDEFMNGLSWFDTIKYGNKNASDEQVLEAAREAGLIQSYADISILKTRSITLNDQDNSPIEKRRLAIARAILKGGLCLILDNPTAGLAYHDEIDILQTLIRLSSQLITIMATDRLYLLEHYVHKIFYLQDGSLKEEGTYQTLTQDHPESSFHQALLQQKNKPLSERFYPVIDQPSVIAKNYRSSGYSQNPAESMTIVQNKLLATQEARLFYV